MVGKSDIFEKFNDKMKRNTQRNGMFPQDAQVQIIGSRFKGIQRGSIFPQAGKIGHEVFRQKAAENNIAVESHTDVVNSERQMTQCIFPKKSTFGVVTLHFSEKFLQGAAALLLKAAG